MTFNDSHMKLRVRKKRQSRFKARCKCRRRNWPGHHQHYYYEGIERKDILWSFAPTQPHSIPVFDEFAKANRPKLEQPSFCEDVLPFDRKISGEFKGWPVMVKYKKGENYETLWYRSVYWFTEVKPSKRCQREPRFKDLGVVAREALATLARGCSS